MSNASSSDHELTLWIWLDRVLKAPIDPQGMSAEIKLTLAVLSSYMCVGHETFPTYETLASRIGRHRATVIKCIKRAEELGYIQIRRRSGHSNCYYISLPSQPPMVAVGDHRGSRGRPQGVAVGDPNTSNMNTSKLKHSPLFPPEGGRKRPPEVADAPKPPEPQTPVKVKGLLTQQQQVWFDEFWGMYPKREGKIDATRAFRTHVRSEEDFRLLMDGLRRDLPDFQSRERKYIPFPQRWVNQQRWKETPEPIEPEEDEWERTKREIAEENRRFRPAWE